YNHGREGWADASGSILRDRRRSMRNLMATLLLANGVPMLNAGDELGRTQWGNNNPYCLDIEEIWFDWELEPWREDLLETARFLTGLRRRHPVLRQRTFHTGQPVSADGSLDVAWYGTDGAELDTEAWESASTHTLQMLLDGAWLDTDSLLIVLHGGGRESTVTLPKAPGLLGYSLLWDSAWEHPSDGADSPATQGAPLLPGTPVTVEAASLRIYRAQDPT
ncbi:MAG: glycogen debranching enzyme GlgX, partial [Dermatophilaceae bacterium]